MLGERLRKAGAVALAGSIMALSVPWAVLADDISNNLDASVDATAEAMNLIAGGSNGTTQLRVITQNEDGKNGCNLTGSTTLVVSVASSNITAATVSPSSITFESCGDTPTLTVTPLAAGSATVSLIQTSNNTSGTFNLAPATFTVNVTAPPPPPPPADTTAPSITPQITGVLGSNGWYTSDVTLSWLVVDHESTISSTSGCDTITITTDQAATTYTCTATSAGGTASQSVTIKRDATDPELSAALDKAPATSGWFNSSTGAPTVDYTCSDATSGIAGSCPSSYTFGEGENQSHSATVYDNAGNSQTAGVSNVDVDLTAPTLTDLGPMAGPDGSNGWYKTAVSNQFRAEDSISGFVSGSAYIFTQSSGTAEGSAVKISSGSVSDIAGNVASAIDSAAFKIDLSDPYNIAFVGGPSTGGAYYFGSVPAAPTCTADDDISGLASCVVTGYSSAVGSHTLIATATDNAGNKATVTRSYTVLAWTLLGFYSPVNMSPAGGPLVYNTVKGGSTVPLKFEIFAGPTELTSTSIVSLASKEVSCTATASEDAIEETTATGGTSLRYDSTAGQYVYNWQTPQTPGKCYQVTMTAQDGSKISAYFKIK